MDEFIAMQREVWTAGDYAELSQHITQVGELVVAQSGVAQGMDVLDVACGTGNAALPAALAGARVTGLDLVPKLLDAGRAKAASAGVEIEFVEGNAEELPFADDSFDRVLSTFGHMFAPRHGATASEIARVCRAGGAIGLCCWTPTGTVGRVFQITGSFMPPPPDFAQPPVLWGSEDHVRELFADAATSFEFSEHSATIEWESAEGFFEYFSEHFGPLVTAKGILGERFAEMREAIIELWEELNVAEDGTFVLPQEYLLSVVRL